MSHFRLRSASAEELAEFLSANLKVMTEEETLAVLGN
jgi:hypothetical protein